jgi:phenylalanyl-tRNA synthetase beta chain
MKVSLSWLKDYVDIDMDVAKLADMLTMAGLEVEAVEDRYAYLERVVVGSITGVEPHPKADKLTPAFAWPPMTNGATS